MAPAEVRVVHALRQGVTLCGKSGAPSDWEPGHVWTYAEIGLNLKLVTCPGCKAVLERDELAKQYVDMKAYAEHLELKLQRMTELVRSADASLAHCEGIGVGYYMGDAEREELLALLDVKPPASHHEHEWIDVSSEDDLAKGWKRELCKCGVEEVLKP